MIYTNVNPLHPPNTDILNPKTSGEPAFKFSTVVVWYLYLYMYIYISIFIYIYIIYIQDFFGRWVAVVTWLITRKKNNAVVITRKGFVFFVGGGSDAFFKKLLDRMHLKAEAARRNEVGLLVFQMLPEVVAVWGVQSWSHPKKLGGGFKYLLFFTPIWGRFPFWLVFFKGVETTN